MTGRVLVWQWGRFGAGPRIAVLLAGGLEALPGVQSVLSLSRAAELLDGGRNLRCELPVETYAGVAGLAWRLVQAPLQVRRLVRRLRDLAPSAALCAMPSPLDLLMVAALRRLGVPIAVIVHDAAAHPGDRFLCCTVYSGHFCGARTWWSRCPVTWRRSCARADCCRRTRRCWCGRCRRWPSAPWPRRPIARGLGVCCALADCVPTRGSICSATRCVASADARITR